LASTLRALDRGEAEALGYTARSGIRSNFYGAMHRKTALVGSQVVAMWGLCGPSLGDIGYPYLMTSPLIEKIPITFIKIARKEVAHMLRHRLRLEGYVAANYRAAVRLLEVLGFTVEKEAPFGPKDALFRKFYVVR
jgi:hypothetical protein